VRDPGLLKELHGLKTGVVDESGIDEDLLIRLWEQRDSLPKLGPLVKESLFTRNSTTSQLFNGFATTSLH